jgi:hypothetical protein
VNTSDQKSEYRQKSTVKPKWTEEDTKRNVKSSSAKRRLSVVPTAPPVPMAPVLSSRGGKGELHGLATLAQRFRQIVTVSSSFLYNIILFGLHWTHMPPKSKDFWQPRY